MMLSEVFLDPKSSKAVWYSDKKYRLWNQIVGVQIPALLPIDCATLGKLLNLSVHPFPTS